MSTRFRRSRLPKALGLLAVLALSPARGSADELPPDLALVHPDAAGFVHVRLAEVWNNPELKDFRKIIDKAGPKALAALDEQFVPKPSSVERITVVVLPITDFTQPPTFVAIVRFSAPFDQATVRKAYAPNGKAATVGKREMVADEQTSVAMHFADNQTILFADPKSLTDYLTLAPKPDGALAETIRAAAGKPVTAAVNVARLPLPPGVAEGLPDDFKPLVKARVVSLTMALGKETVLDARISYANPAEAGDAEKALRKAAQMAKLALALPKSEAAKFLYEKKPADGPRPLEDLPQAVAAVAALGGLATLEEILSDPPVKVDGNAVATTVTLPAWTTGYFGTAAVSTGLLLPAVQKVREAAARTQSMNNLKQIGLAMHNFHDVTGLFPAAAIADKKTGKPLLSWRVAILPYIEQQALYNQFKLDEPWDSENNKKLIPMLPKVYVDARMPPLPGTTYYKVFVGKDTAFPPTEGRKIQNITDGTSNTIMVVAAGDPVIWTKPDDIPFDPEKPLPDLMKPFRNVVAAFCDGSVRVIAAKVDEKTLKAVITATGGEIAELP